MAAGKSRGKARETGELPIAPMIDVVFLLLIYFMVSSTLERQEADLSFALPATVVLEQPMSFPDEQIVILDERGQASVNGYGYDEPEDRVYARLAAMLARFRASSEASRSQARITVAPHDQTPHEAVVKVMDACSLAGVSNVSFAVE